MPVAVAPQTAPSTSSDCPCAHNSWDNVRVKKGFITLRCRQCQAQWKTETGRPKCSDFTRGSCTLGPLCPYPHIHRYKQSLGKRQAIFGEDLDEMPDVPVEQSTTAGKRRGKRKRKSASEAPDEQGAEEQDTPMLFVPTCTDGQQQEQLDASTSLCAVLSPGVPAMAQSMPALPRRQGGVRSLQVEALGMAASTPLPLSPVDLVTAPAQPLHNLSALPIFEDEVSEMAATMPLPSPRDADAAPAWGARQSTFDSSMIETAPAPYLAASLPLPQRPAQAAEAERPALHRACAPRLSFGGSEVSSPTAAPSPLSGERRSRSTFGVPSPCAAPTSGQRVPCAIVTEDGRVEIASACGDDDDDGAASTGLTEKDVNELMSTASSDLAGDAPRYIPTTRAERQAAATFGAPSASPLVSNKPSIFGQLTRVDSCVSSGSSSFLNSPYAQVGSLGGFGSRVASITQPPTDQRLAPPLQPSHVY